MNTDTVGTICFALAVLHTFLVRQLQRVALRFQPGSVMENLFHLLAEVEVVFGFWAGVFLAFLAASDGGQAIEFLESQNFTEPGFVFVILVICSTKPVLSLAKIVIQQISTLLPLSGELPFFVTTLTLGPLLGSFVTEPAAMTLTAFLLMERVFSRSQSLNFKYAVLGLLFVNVSVGGTLTPFAAPPVLMVAKTWRWDLPFMLENFGWKAMLAVFISTSLTAWCYRRDLMALPRELPSEKVETPLWVSALHLVFLVLVVINAHHMSVFIMLFLFFLGVVKVTKEYQSELKISEGLLVAFFLGGLVILGSSQRWWLEPLLGKLGTYPLYVGVIGLTAVTDNAALTYLGSQVPDLQEIAKYALVAGSVVGGGLTVIANAPNPVGYGILHSAFGEEGISPWRLFVSALVPTLIAAACFWPLGV